MLRIGFIVLLLGLSACALPETAGQHSAGLGQEPIRQLYIVPFETIMVPQEVAASLFDQFVDRLNERGADLGIEFVILKQERTQVDPQWLARRAYLLGEIYAYVEDAGSSMTEIKARSRIRLYRPGQAVPALQLTQPAEAFYQNDYSSLTAERHRLAAQISTGLADQLILALSGD